MSTSSSDTSGEAAGDAELHAFACEITRRAGDLQLSRYERPGEVREKAPKDVVTEVDLLCEEFLISRIEERYPEDSILSEERGGEVSETGRTWLLDPVDGTANFSRANPLFCCCVSLVERGEVTHAAVAVPRLGDLYHASRGEGAYREGAGSESVRLKVGKTASLEYAFVGADLSFTRRKNDLYREALEEIFASCWQFRSLGSAGIRGAWVAAGYLDVSIGTNNTAWDYAPTALMVAEAGGRVSGLSGEPWTPNSDGLIAAASEPLHAEILEKMSHS